MWLSALWTWNRVALWPAPWCHKCGAQDHEMIRNWHHIFFHMCAGYLAIILQMAPQTLRGVLVFGVGWTAAAAAITSISITAGQRILHCLKRVFFDGPRRRSRRPIHHSSATLDQCKTYIASLGSHQMICDADLRRDHHFWAEAHSFRSDPALAQSKARISNEIRSLSTSLPLHWESSIFLAIDENHMNMMRALIIPGEATPYANGMFLFDIFLPQEYPNVPPKVQFLTTYGGRIRFNPNLYTDGRVCLSLLGTWDGPSWKPSSTVLQASAVLLINRHKLKRFCNRSPCSVLHLKLVEVSLVVILGDLVSHGRHRYLNYISINEAIQFVGGGAPPVSPIECSINVGCMNWYVQKSD